MINKFSAAEQLEQNMAFLLSGHLKTAINNSDAISNLQKAKNLLENAGLLSEATKVSIIIKRAQTGSDDMEIILGEPSTNPKTGEYSIPFEFSSPVFGEGRGVCASSLVSENVEDAEGGINSALYVEILNKLQNVGVFKDRIAAVSKAVNSLDLSNMARKIVEGL